MDEALEAQMKDVETQASNPPNYKRFIGDFTLGFADGLTVPFALTAGLSSLGSSKFVIIGGLAELFSGSISMSLGAYLSAQTDFQQYANERHRKLCNVAADPDAEVGDTFKMLCAYGPNKTDVAPFVEALRRDETNWIQFTMDMTLKQEQPTKRTAYISAVVMGLSYFLGGLIPMVPYFAIKDTQAALWVSIAITAVTLIVFGYVKAQISSCTQSQSVVSSMQTLCIGAVAAGASYGIVRAVNLGHLA